MTGFLDTGNFLYEPVTKMPVSVMDPAVFAEHFHEPITNLMEKEGSRDIRMIPYRSVGKNSGIMWGILADEIQITNGNQRMKIEKGIIGLSEEKLSEEGRYDLLLHPDLIKYGRS